MRGRVPAAPAVATAVCLAVALILPAAVQADKDVGVEWINQFPDNDGAETLTPGHRDECAGWFYSEFTMHGWTGRFALADNQAWEDDFKDVSNGGNDRVDTVDISMLASHGSPSGVAFNSRHDDQKIRYDEAEWGDDADLEWIILDACSCLAQASHNNWTATFEGLHTILAFDTTAHDKKNRGKRLAEKLFSGYSLVQAWWHAAETTEGCGTWAAAKGVQAPHDTYNDHIHGEGSVANDSRPPGRTFWYQHHNCD